MMMMTTNYTPNITEQRRRVRRMALQMLYQIEARGGEDLDSVLDSLQNASGKANPNFQGPWKVTTSANEDEHEEAFARARAAWDIREQVDALTTELAPDWPTHRQPALDRNVIRLCWYEMTLGGIPPKAAVNEAIELGKMFGTDRSAGFLNGILDKLLRKVLQEDSASSSTESETDTDEPVIDQTVDSSDQEPCENA